MSDIATRDPRDEDEGPVNGAAMPTYRSNPFANDVAVVQPMIGALANAEQQRAIAEIQARMIIARSNPRDPIRAMDHIINDCSRPTLAATALYAYARGGIDITGPTIRLAESIARRWGNIASGIKEISRTKGNSECVAYAWDLETGYYDERQFQIRHWRDVKVSAKNPRGGYPITDERDIYELIANLGQRRKRAVLLTVIPGDVVEAAVEACEATLHATADLSSDSLKKLADAFAAYGVNQAMIEVRIQRRLDSIRPAQVVQLRKIYASLKDGLSEASDWFEGAGATDVVDAKTTRSPGVATGAGAASAERGPDQDIGQTVKVGPTAGENPATSLQKPKPAAKPQQAKAADPTPSAPAFEHYLIDEAGDFDTMTHTDPVKWAEAFIALHDHTQDMPTFLENNEQALEQAKQVPAAAAILAAMEKPVTAAPVALKLATLRNGKPDWSDYINGFKHILASQQGDLGAWLEAQRPVMVAAPLPSKLLLIKAVRERGDRIRGGLPDWLVELAKPAEKQPGLHLAPTGDAPDDERWVEDLTAHLATLTSIAAWETYGKAAEVQAVMSRLRQTNRALFDKAYDAFEARRIELATPPPDDATEEEARP
jgi:hypothetical protein